MKKLREFLGYLGLLLMVAFLLSLLNCGTRKKKEQTEKDTSYLASRPCMMGDSALTVLYETRRYRGMFESQKSLMGEAKWLTFCRETSLLPKPYTNDVTEPSGIRYRGKYAFDSHAITTAYKEMGWGIPSMEDYHNFLQDPDRQELCMDALLDYFYKEFLKAGIEPTAEELTLAHWKGFNGALYLIRKKR
jgi:hypothetical protein